MSLDIAFLKYILENRPTFQKVLNAKSGIAFSDERVGDIVNFLIQNLYGKWKDESIPTKDALITILNETDEEHIELAKFLESEEFEEIDWTAYGHSMNDFTLALKEREYGRKFNTMIETVETVIHNDGDIEKAILDFARLIESKKLKTINPTSIDSILDKDCLLRGETMYPTHIPELNLALGDNKDKGGIAAGEITIIGGYSNVGKSILSQSIFTGFIEKYIPCVYFNLEVRPALFINQFFSQITGQRIYTGISYTDEELKFFNIAWEKYRKFIEDRKDIFLIYNEDGPRNLLQLEEYIEKHAMEGYEVIFLDTINSLVGGESERRTEMFTRVMNSLEALVKKYNIALVSTAQIKQSLMQQIDKRPNLWDIGESAALQQKAGTVLGIYRSDKYGENPVSKIDSKCDYTSIMLLKLRNRSADPGEFVKVSFDRYKQMYIPYSGLQPEFSTLEEEEQEMQLCLN